VRYFDIVAVYFGTHQRWGGISKTCVTIFCQLLSQPLDHYLKIYYFIHATA